MVDAARARRLAVRIREIVAATLERQVKDPRLGMVTITDARVTPDLREATVYYTVYGDETDRTDSAAALDSAKGVLRSSVGRQTGVKFTPTLTFVADAVPETARHIDDLLARARAADEDLHRAARGAVPAGAANPYRTGGDEEPDGEPEPTGAAATPEPTGAAATPDAASADRTGGTDARASGTPR